MIMIVALQKIKFNKIIGYKSNKTKKNREKIGEGVEKKKNSQTFIYSSSSLSLGGTGTGSCSWSSSFSIIVIIIFMGGIAPPMLEAVEERPRRMEVKRGVASGMKWKISSICFNIPLA